MSKRNVTLKVTSQKELIKAQTEARTFGDLQKEMKNVKWNGMRVVVRETKNTLQKADALLPAGDFILFLVPEKVKSGGPKKKLKDIAKASYNDLRSHGSYLNNEKGAQINISGSTEVIRKSLQAYYNAKNPAKAGKSAPVEEVVNEDSEIAVAAIEAARIKMNEAIDVIVANAGSGGAIKVVEDATEYLIKVSLEDLDEELAEIKRDLNL